MFIIKGIFISSGKKAVNLTDNDDGIIMNIKDDNATWHTVDITGKSDYLTITTNISNQDLTLKFKQLKDKQYFIIECLGQANNPIIAFHNMIGNVDGIIMADVGVEKVNRKNLFNWTGIWLLTLGFMWFAISDLTEDYRLKPTYYNMLNQTIARDSVKENYRHYVFKSAISHKLEDTLYSYPDTYNLEYEKDSVHTRSKESMSQFRLLFGLNTDTLKINQHFSVIYKINYSLSDLIVVLPILLFLLSSLVLLSVIHEYNRFKKVDKLASKLLNEIPT